MSTKGGNMPYPRILATLVLLAACRWASPALAAEPAGLTEAEFKKLHKQLQPSKNELWSTIPWKVSVREARLLAAKKKKPILVWAQNGHPLAGC
jgi:hypothetical protein